MTTRRVLAFSLAFIFAASALVFIGCAPSKELVAYYEAKVKKQEAEDAYAYADDLNAQYKDELASELKTLENAKEKHAEIHATRNVEEERRGDPITPLLHGKEDPEQKLDWM